MEYGKSQRVVRRVAAHGGRTHGLHDSRRVTGESSLDGEPGRGIRATGGVHRAFRTIARQSGR